MVKKLYYLACICVAICVTTSCQTVANYAVSLKSVESPTNPKQQFGETKIVSFDDGKLSKYRYEDDYINIVWTVDAKHFYFEVQNKTNYTLKINWDDVSYVDCDGGGIKSNASRGKIF